MEYRSTNVDGFVHFGGDVVAGVNATAGVKLSSNSVSPVGDAAAIDLYIMPKGTGKLYLGNNTNAVAFVNGESTTTIPNMPANSQNVSTLAAAGISTGDLIVCCDPGPRVSTGVAFSRAYPSAANEITIVWTNPHASSIAAESTGIVVRWSYLDRT